MPTVTLDFDTYNINTSAQIGDTVYYCYFETDGGFSTNSSDIIEIGVIKNFQSESIIDVTPINTSLLLPETAFILFSKDNAVNMSSPLGYYSLIQFKNNSTVKSEIFSIGCEIFESSK